MTLEQQSQNSLLNSFNETRNTTLQLIKNEQYFIKGIEQISLVNWFIVLFFSISSLFFAWYRESK